MTSDDRNGTNDREYSNDEITVYWKPSKCIHVTTCYRELIEVFNPRKRPWINMQGAETDEIIRVVELCPTDALSYSLRNDNKKATEVKVEPTSQNSENDTPQGAEIRVMQDGPLVIKGNFILTGSGGETVKQMKMVSICRCGHSSKMPYCDGTHRKIGFAAD